MKKEIIIGISMLCSFNVMASDCSSVKDINGSELVKDRTSIYLTEIKDMGLADFYLGLNRNTRIDFIVDINSACNFKNKKGIDTELSVIISKYVNKYKDYK